MARSEPLRNAPTKKKKNLCTLAKKKKQKKTHCCFFYISPPNFLSHHKKTFFQEDKKHDGPVPHRTPEIRGERVLLHFGPPERSVGSSGRRDRACVPGRLFAPVHSAGLHTAAQIHQPLAPQTGRDPQTGAPAARARPVLYRHHVRAGAHVRKRYHQTQKGQSVRPTVRFRTRRAQGSGDRLRDREKLPRGEPYCKKKKPKHPKGFLFFCALPSKKKKN